MKQYTFVFNETETAVFGTALTLAANNADLDESDRKLARAMAIRLLVLCLSATSEETKQ